MSQDARADEERNTRNRAQILGLAYADTYNKDKPLFKDFLPLNDLYALRIIPLNIGDHFIQFGITNTTSRDTMRNLKNQFLDQQVSFLLISDAGYREYMSLYDPPKKVEYTNIEMSNAGNIDKVKEVSAILEQVKANDILAYLVQQAHRLGGSDIHLEPQRGYVRIRFRVDGVLHVIARLSYEKFRVLMSAVAAAGNIYTSSEDAQQGHIAQHIIMADGAEVDVNLRLETVPGINGIEVVMRLFNMSSEMYQLDRLGLSPDERQVVDDIINKPSGMVMVVMMH
jgi:type II secretory ATPase GspE/PulE/Tfp pilus assembly ATPase PilB-like protein